MKSGLSSQELEVKISYIAEVDSKNNQSIINKARCS